MKEESNATQEVFVIAPSAGGASSAAIAAASMWRTQRCGVVAQHALMIAYSSIVSTDTDDTCLTF